MQTNIVSELLERFFENFIVRLTNCKWCYRSVCRDYWICHKFWFSNYSNLLFKNQNGGHFNQTLYLQHNIFFFSIWCLDLNERKFYARFENVFHWFSEQNDQSELSSFNQHLNMSTKKNRLYYKSTSPMKMFYKKN